MKNVVDGDSFAGTTIMHAPREKRSSAELAKLTEQLCHHVIAHPGQRVEEIKQALGTTAAELKLPRRKLMAKGCLRSSSRTRGTRYFPAALPDAALVDATIQQLAVAGAGVDPHRRDATQSDEASRNA